MSAEKLMFKIGKGVIEPADSFTSQKLRDRKYSIGDIVAVTITKPRNPGFWRLAHQLGTLVAENIESFEDMKSHQVLKRIQLEGRIECDEIAYLIPNVGMITQFVPRSLSYESMSDEVFHDVYEQMCKWLVKQYWPSETTDGIMNMAEMMQ